MSSPSDQPSWTSLFTGTTLAWFGLSVLMATQDTSLGASPSAWLQAWLLTAPRWGPGLLLTLVVFALARTAPVRGAQWKRNLTLHAGAAVGLTILGIGLQQGLLRALRPAYAARVEFLDGVRSVLRNGTRRRVSRRHRDALLTALGATA